MLRPRCTSGASSVAFFARLWQKPLLLLTDSSFKGLVQPAGRRRQRRYAGSARAQNAAPLGYARFHDAHPGRRKIGRGRSAVREGSHNKFRTEENGLPLVRRTAVNEQTDA